MLKSTYLLDIGTLYIVVFRQWVLGYFIPLNDFQEGQIYTCCNKIKNI
jgi:hypothetical protein